MTASSLALQIRITARLFALGKTTDAVAATLIDGEFCGQRRQSDACPVARYLLAVIPELTSVYVGRTLIEAKARTVKVESVPPTAVERFVEAFDRGCFPGLIEPLIRTQSSPVVLESGPTPDPAAAHGGARRTPDAGGSAGDRVVSRTVPGAGDIPIHKLAEAYAGLR